MLEPWYSVNHIRSLAVPSRLVEGGGSAVLYSIITSLTAALTELVQGR